MFILVQIIFFFTRSGVGFVLFCFIWICVCLFVFRLFAYFLWLLGFEMNNNLLGPQTAFSKPCSDRNQQNLDDLPEVEYLS